MTRDLEKDTAAAGHGGPADGRTQAAGGTPIRKSVNTKALLAVLFGTAFIASFNENIVNVALVDIMAEFSVDTVTAQWMVTGYMMVSAVITAVIAFLMRRLTLRQSFFAGGIILALGSAIDFVAPNFAVLLGARLFQAVGTGIFVPIMMNTVLMIAPRKKLGTYLSIGSCCITFGPAFGPVVSGLMVTYFGWRAMFLPTFVAVVVLMIAGLAFVKPLVPTQKVKLDVLSVLLAAAGLISFIFGLLLISSNPLQAVVLVAVAVAVIAVFARRQDRLETPLLNLEPLRASGFSLACILVIFAMMTTFSMSVLLPLYFEGASGLTAFAAGFLVLIPILVNAGAALVGGRVMDSRGEWPLLPAGFLLVAAGMVAVSLIAGSLQIGLVVAAACVVYAGVGLVMSPSQTAGLKQIPHRLNADGVSLISLLDYGRRVRGPVAIHGHPVCVAVVVACRRGFGGAGLCRRFRSRHGGGRGHRHRGYRAGVLLFPQGGGHGAGGRAGDEGRNGADGPFPACGDETGRVYRAQRPARLCSRAADAGA